MVDFFLDVVSHLVNGHVRFGEHVHIDRILPVDTVIALWVPVLVFTLGEVVQVDDLPLDGLYRDRLQRMAVPVHGEEERHPLNGAPPVGLQDISYDILPAEEVADRLLNIV